MFSIIIPTFNNLDYLKLCIKSIRQNSKYTHQIIPHVNIGVDGTRDFLRDENIDFTFTKYNSGICEGMNTASKKSKFKYILYSHDDFYFCPGWDVVLKNEIDATSNKVINLGGSASMSQTDNTNASNPGFNFSGELGALASLAGGKQTDRSRVLAVVPLAATARAPAPAPTADAGPVWTRRWGASTWSSATPPTPTWCGSPTSRPTAWSDTRTCWPRRSSRRWRRWTAWAPPWTAAIWTASWWARGHGSSGPLPGSTPARAWRSGGWRASSAACWTPRSASQRCAPTGRPSAGPARSWKVLQLVSIP